MKLIPEDLAAELTQRPPVTIRRWAREGRITRHADPGRRRNGVLYDLDELPAATRDEITGEWIIPPPPPLPHNQPAAT